jgi:hypothetical protein
VVVEPEVEPGRFMEMRSYNADAATVTVLARRAEDHYNPASHFQVGCGGCGGCRAKSNDDLLRPLPITSTGHASLKGVTVGL